jgi:hypothetical protein
MDEVKEKKDKLQEKAMALATKVYEEASKNAEAENADTEETTEAKKSKKKGKDDDVQEAEYEEK